MFPPSGKSNVHRKESDLDMYIREAGKTRNGMYDSLIIAFMYETGLKPSEIMLVEEMGDFGVKYYYAQKAKKD